MNVALSGYDFDDSAKRPRVCRPQGMGIGGRRTGRYGDALTLYVNGYVHDIDSTTKGASATGTSPKSSSPHTGDVPSGTLAALGIAAACALCLAVVVMLLRHRHSTEHAGSTHVIMSELARVALQLGAAGNRGAL